MLKFFRQIRQRLINQGQIKKYTIYAIGEILLVVIGILIALQINTWNNESIKRQEEIKMLKEIKVGFESDYRDLEGNKRVLEEAMTSTQIIKKVFYKDFAYHDSLSVHFARIFATPIFVANTSAFETLKSKGVDLISNDTLRVHILNMYDFEYERIKLIEGGFFLNHEFISEKIVQHFDHVALFGKGGYLQLRPNDFEALKKDREFLSIFKTKAHQTESYNIALVAVIMKKLEPLLLKIQKEIDHLEK